MFFAQAGLMVSKFFELVVVNFYYTGLLLETSHELSVKFAQIQRAGLSWPCSLIASSIFLMQAHLNREVKFLASPWISMTSDCKVDKNDGVETPSELAIASIITQNERSSLIEVLWPFNLKFLVIGS